MKCLCIDIGNSRVKYGIFEKDSLLEISYSPKPNIDKIDQLLYNHNFKNIIISSVRPIDDVWLNHLQSISEVLLLDHLTPLPIQNEYQKPESLGKDRLAAAVGASILQEDQACLIVDAGTCITYDVLDPQARYQGGNIAPGLQMRLDAMHHFTAKLPSLTLDEGQDGSIGKSTPEAIMNGACLGVLYELQGYIESLEVKFGQLMVICTGGNAEYLAKRLKNKIFVRPNLVLEGLNKILTYNVHKNE